MVWTPCGRASEATRSQRRVRSGSWSPAWAEARGGAPWRDPVVGHGGFLAGVGERRVASARRAPMHAPQLPPSPG